MHSLFYPLIINKYPEETFRKIFQLKIYLKTTGLILTGKHVIS